MLIVGLTVVVTLAPAPPPSSILSKIRCWPDRISSLLRSTPSTTRSSEPSSTSVSFAVFARPWKSTAGGRGGGRVSGVERFTTRE